MESGKYIVKRFVEELWNARRSEVADQIFSEDCVTHQLRSGVSEEPARRGPQAMKEHISGWVTSFSDLRFRIEQMIAEQDRVVSQRVMERHPSQGGRSVSCEQVGLASLKTPPKPVLSRKSAHAESDG
jgi:predicted ester cyclase